MKNTKVNMVDLMGQYNNIKKEVDASPLPPGSPGLKEMVDHFKATSPVKRKLESSNDDSPVKKKKSKKVRIH